MKLQLRSFLALLLIFFINNSYGQRYYNPVFPQDSIQIMNNLQYGINYDAATVLGSDTIIDTLKLDLYMPPASDTVALRPLFIYCHTGSFLDTIANGAPTGDKSDSTCVNFCRQWAETGYVGASINYRLGWAPSSNDPDTRKGTLLQAVYSGLEDTRNAIRFFRNSFNNGNPYHIDSSKIIVFGEGSGGYLSLACATLDTFSKVSSEPKFLDANTNLPYVDTTVMGNIHGFGGSKNMNNYPGINDNADFAVNMGGALADTSWLDAGQCPIVAFQCVRDPFAPYDSGIVIVPATNEDVVAVFGSGVFMHIVDSLGNNNGFINHTFTDPYTLAARSYYNLTVAYNSEPDVNTIGTGNGEGLYPFLLPIDDTMLDNQSSPWQFWNPNQYDALAPDAGTDLTCGEASELSDQGMSPTKGLTYIDTVQHYLLERIMVQFLLPGYETAGISDVIPNADLSIYPNPASSVLNVVVKDNQYLMNTVSLYDITGRLVRTDEVNNTGRYSVQVGSMTAGIYFLNIHFTNGAQTNAKVVIE